MVIGEKAHISGTSELDTKYWLWLNSYDLRLIHQMDVFGGQLKQNSS